MVKNIKTACVLTVLFFVLIITGLIIGRNAYAGGGINWKVTVHNPTDYKIKVWAYVRLASLSEKLTSSGVVINPGGTYTFETGDKCPTGIEGQIYVDKKWLKMKSMDCLGGAHDYDTAVMSTCCWNLSARACQKAGQGYTEVRDHDYGFCKD